MPDASPDLRSYATNEIGTDNATAAAFALVYVGDQLARIAVVLEELAPATRNGAGEVLGRTVNVAAALRPDYGDQPRPAADIDAPPPAGFEGETRL